MINCCFLTFSISCVVVRWFECQTRETRTEGCQRPEISLHRIDIGKIPSRHSSMATEAGVKCVSIYIFFFYIYIYIMCSYLYFILLWFLLKSRISCIKMLLHKYHYVFCIQAEVSNQMYRAVLEQVSKFLERTNSSLNTPYEKPSLPFRKR